MNQRKRKPSDSYKDGQLDPASKQKAEKLFEKKFTYSKPYEEPWNLPEFDKQPLKWEIQELQATKADLNNLKDKLSDKDMISWHEHTGYMNYASKIISEIRQRFQPELCTQAWCKFYEIVSTYSIVDLDAEKFNSVHLCEAPGAFVTSLNHYLISNDFRGDWTWLASTLNPYYEGNSLQEMIDDDKFIRGCYTNWYFGVDGTGNVMDINNLKGLMEHVESIGPVHLVTADGSIDCQNNPAEQELEVSRLHYCEVFTALLILTPGGSFVVKMFTMFESCTVCLVYLLNCLFEQVNVFKPATSKSGNSEVYFVCIGFQGIQNKDYFMNFCRKFFDSQVSGVNCIFELKDIPRSFLDQHRECCHFFTDIQKETISKNLENYPVLPEHYRTWLDSIKDFCTENYISRYRVCYMSKRNRICPQSTKQFKHKESKSHSGKFLKRQHSGTFIDRQNYKLVPWKEKLKQVETYDVKTDDIVWFERYSAFTYIEEDQVRRWTCLEGKPISAIFSSRFCDGKLLSVMQEIFKYADVNSYMSGLQENLIKKRMELLATAVDNVASDGHLTLVLVETDGHVYESQQVRLKSVTKIISSPLSEIDKVEYNIDIRYIFYLSLIKSTTVVAEKELQVQNGLLQATLQVLQTLPSSSSLVIQMSTCLTRFTAGLIYILSRAFELIGFIQQPGQSTLQQNLFCTNYYGLPEYIVQHLHKVAAHSPEMHMAVLECVPLIDIIPDVDFVTFLKTSNETLLKAFITSIITAEREKYDIKMEPTL